MQNPNNTARVQAAIKGQDRLSGGEMHTLRHALVMAAEKFDANAEEFRGYEAFAKANPEAYAKGAGVMIHVNAYPPLIAQFEQQAAETRALIDWIDGPEELEDGRVTENVVLVRTVTLS